MSDYPDPADIHSQAARQCGAIRKLKEGYGFIAADDGKDYFFHWTAMQRTSKNFRDLAVQERVEFVLIDIIVDGVKKKRAIEVRVIE